jgi:hypothetical protein
VKLNMWVDSTKMNIDRIRLTSKTDSMVSKTPLNVTWTAPDRFVINTTLKPKTNYVLKVDTSAFRSFNGMVNDSVKVPFSILKKSDLGSLTLKITFNRKQAYVIQLINGAGNTVKEDKVSFSLSASNTATLVFKDIPEDTYHVRIIYDMNEDLTWNTGNFLKNVQPEKTYIFEKAIKILPDWEVEEEFLLKE